MRVQRTRGEKCWIKIDKREVGWKVGCLKYDYTREGSVSRWVGWKISSTRVQRQFVKGERKVIGISIKQTPLLGKTTTFGSNKQTNKKQTILLGKATTFHRNWEIISLTSSNLQFSRVSIKSLMWKTICSILFI